MTQAKPAQTRWGQGVRVDPESARTMILEAANRCYLRRGITRTTVEHVAREARVSRTTVYRHFQNRDEILTGVVLRDSRSLLAFVEHALVDVTDFGEFLREAMVLILREVPHAPLYNSFMGPDSDSGALVSRLCISSEEVLSLILPVVEPRFTRAATAGRLRPGVTLAGVLEWTARLMLSFMSVPSDLTRNEATLRQALDAYLVTALLRDVRP